MLSLTEPSRTVDYDYLSFWNSVQLVLSTVCVVTLMIMTSLEFTQSNVIASFIVQTHRRSGHAALVLGFTLSVDWFIILYQFSHVIVIQCYDLLLHLIRMTKWELQCSKLYCIPHTVAVVKVAISCSYFFFFFFFNTY